MCCHLCKSRSFVSLLGWSIQECVNTMAKRKDISSDLREAIVAAHQSVKGYKVIYKSFSLLCFFEKDYLHVENIQDSCQFSQEWLSQHVNLEVRLCNAPRN